MDLATFLLTLITSAGASILLSAALLWLARSWISERLHRSIQHEYDQKLALLNASLKAEAEKNAALLKATMERESDRLRFATASIGETQKAAIERRLDGLDTLWAAMLAARDNIPPVMSFIDILTVEEYRSQKDHPDFRKLAGEVSPEKLAAMFKDNVGSRERIRPYVGEYLWALVSTYQALILRVALLLHWGQKDEEKLSWHKDSGIQQLLRSSLSPTEFSDFDGVKIGKVGWLQRLYEQKVLAAMQVVISGQVFGEEALQQAQRMEEKVQAYKPGGPDA